MTGSFRIAVALGLAVMFIVTASLLANLGIY